MKIKTLLFCITATLCGTLTANAADAVEGLSASIAIKKPGNKAVSHTLNFIRQEVETDAYTLQASDGELPLNIVQTVSNDGSRRRITVSLTAHSRVYFNFKERLSTGFSHDDCLFYMPGFWYRRNLRSPKQAPSFHTSDSWTVREDRLSTPLVAAFSQKAHRAVSVVRIDSFKHDAPTTREEGEVILAGPTSIGYTGFENVGGTATLSFGYPYSEKPYSYIRKLTLAPPVEAFAMLDRGETMTLQWEVNGLAADSFADCVSGLWTYSYDTYSPQPVQVAYSDEHMKEVMSNYFKESFVKAQPCYYASAGMRVDDCASPELAEVGFVGRTLLNAFNALEYGESHNRTDLVKDARAVFDSYLRYGFSFAGYFNEVIDCKKGKAQTWHSIRRQSEGVCAVLYYLDYERRNGRLHPEWEQRMKSILDLIVRRQKADGSFPRKFNDDGRVVDAGGGSTPSATLPLVMGSRYFGNHRWLMAARRTMDYIEKEIITPSDYFSSTLDADCEDKEASLYSATAAYCMALSSHGSQRRHYAEQCRQAAYFALSWYYTWDVPFAQGQMLGDIGLKTRGWGNVSVENNHIDVFVFDFVDVLKWLSHEFKEPRFMAFSNVISTSIRQILPCEGNLCGVAKVGYYPEVVQHTHWDYGRNGKGFYNDIFAPGWTVASLWEMLTLGRAARLIER